jgi:hypothetical protein
VPIRVLELEVKEEKRVGRRRRRLGHMSEDGRRGRRNLWGIEGGGKWGERRG